jgi:hypothetical protein
MNNSFKILFILISFVSLTSVNCETLKKNNVINYNKYIKNYYNIPSYSSIEECMKNNFYDSVYKHIYHFSEEKKEIFETENEIVYYKNKLDSIVNFYN